MSPLRHRPQAALYGCMYHALYALTGDEGWLAHVDDFSEPRWLARIQAEGGAVLVYYADLLLDTRTPPMWWDALRAIIPADGQGGRPTTHMPLLATVDGLSGRRHLVALALPVVGRDDVHISDSALPDLQVLTWAEFQASPYARASRVEQIIPGDLNHYAHQSAAEILSQQDASAYAM